MRKEDVLTIIDSHEHVILPGENQVKKLEQAGVDKAILFPTTPHPEKARNYEELKEEMGTLYKILAGANTKEANIKRMEEGNRELIKSIKACPDKFYGFGAVPLGLTVDETKEWIEQNIIAGDLKGIGEFTPGSDSQIRQLEPVFHALEDFSQLPVWVHTFHPVTVNGLQILMGLTQKYPDVSVIFGHMGGYNWQTLLDFAKTSKNAYIDTSAAFSTLAVQMAISEVPDRCLFSSDAPYGEPLLNKQLIEFVSPSKQSADMVLGENIEKLLNL